MGRGAEEAFEMELDQFLDELVPPSLDDDDLCDGCGQSIETCICDEIDVGELPW